jgi:hypothetical protein
MQDGTDTHAVGAEDMSRKSPALAFLQLVCFLQIFIFLSSCSNSNRDDQEHCSELTGTTQAGVKNRVSDQYEREFWSTQQ